MTALLGWLNVNLLFCHGTLIIISLFFFPSFPLPHLISAASTYVTTISKWWTGTRLPASFSAGWRQSGAEAGPFLCTAESFVARALPVEIYRVRCLVAIRSRGHLLEPGFFSGFVTNKPIWLCLIIVTKAVQKNMHRLTVRHIESRRWPHKADRSLISLDKCMLKEKPPARKHPGPLYLLCMLHQI